MGKRVPYGRVDLKSVREDGLLYIDKTMYLEKLEQNNVLIYTRPRRFGKSMLTSMLAYYYSINEADNFEKIFKGLYVYDHPTPYKNKYYVLQFNFSGMQTGTDKTLEQIEEQFKVLVISGIKNCINAYNLRIKLNEDGTSADVFKRFLVDFKALNKANKIYVMIDEYDHFTNGMLQGDGKRFLAILGNSGFVRAFYEVIKENLEQLNPPLERFFATGVTPLTLDSLTSGFNIATKITNNPLFTAMCGLTEDEVRYAIKESCVPNSEEVFNKMQENYDGYIFNEYDQSHIFNTTLVMYYLNTLQTLGFPPKNLVDGNLAATGSKIENMAGLINREENYKILDELLMNGEIVANLTESFELEKRFNKDDFISLLFYNGYLTIKEQNGMELKFHEPNYVTKTLYSSYFLELTDIAKKYKIDTSEISSAIIELGQRGNIKPLVEKVSEFLYHCSTRDKENFNEMNLKHVFSMILAFTSQFMTYGEFPAGQGFVDMYIAKAANSLATFEAVVELKYLNKEKARKFNFKKSIKEAREQLERYLEDKRMKDKENLKKFVIVFEGFDKYYIEEL